MFSLAVNAHVCVCVHMHTHTHAHILDSLPFYLGEPEFSFNMNQAALVKLLKCGLLTFSRFLKRDVIFFETSSCLIGTSKDSKDNPWLKRGCDNHYASNIFFPKKGGVLCDSVSLGLMAQVSIVMQLMGQSELCFPGKIFQVCIT